MKRPVNYDQCDKATLVRLLAEADQELAKAKAISKRIAFYKKKILLIESVLSEKWNS